MEILVLPSMEHRSKKKLYTSSTFDSLAMNDDWTVLGVRMMVHDVPDSPPELEQRVGERV